MKPTITPEELQTLETFVAADSAMLSFHLSNGRMIFWSDSCWVVSGDSAKGELDYTYYEGKSLEDALFSAQYSTTPISTYDNTANELQEIIDGISNKLRGVV